METQSHEGFKLQVKAWLKLHGLGYDWLGNQCFASEITVRNWMAKKTIPEAKVFLIKQVMAHYGKQNQCRVNLIEDGVLLHLSCGMKASLEKSALAQSKSLAVYLDEMLLKMAAN